MTFAHITNGAVDATANQLRPVLEDGRWWDLRDPGIRALRGWVEITDTPRPADTESTTWDRGYEVSGGAVTVTWTARPWTAEELAEQGRAQNRDGLLTKLEQARALNNTIIAGADDYLTTQADTATAAQVRAQVKALTQGMRVLARELNGIGLLITNQLDDISDT